MNQLVPVSAANNFTVSDVERVALAIAKGGLFGSKDPNAVLTLCLLAQAEGQHPAVVFRDYHIISGKPAKKAEAMLRDFISSGGKVKWHQLDDTIADATFTHPSGEARIEWTMERAKKAGISTAMWNKYPRQMLRSRVISEGVRTVYPGATSGLYVEEEVSTFEQRSEPEPPAIEHNPQTGEVEDAPREPVRGITKIKERLRALQTAGNAASDLEAFNVLVHERADDLTKIKEANHSWWTGDGEDFEGFRSWIRRRREELSAEESETYRQLMDALNACDTKQSLVKFAEDHGEAVEMLDGAESRRFELAYQLKGSGIEAMDTVDA